MAYWAMAMASSACAPAQAPSQWRTPVHFSFPSSLSFPFPLSLSLLFPLSRPLPRWRRKKSWTPTPLLPPPPQPTNITSVILKAALMLLGSDGSLLLRLYFVHDLWLSTFLQVSAWPILLLSLSISHLFLPIVGPIATHRCCCLFLLPPWPLNAASVILGLLIALDSYPYAYGSSYFPRSTSSLLMASQMAFTAIFAFLIVHQHFTPFSLNSVVLLMLGPIVLNLSGGGNRLIPTFPFSP